MRASKILTILGLLASPLMAWSQSSSSLMIPVNDRTIQRSSVFSQMDLLKEIGKLKPALRNSSDIEIQMVRIEAKSNLGGGQIFLKINSDLVASAVVETNPDNFSSSDPRTFERFELKNIDRSRLSAASLQIQNLESLKIKSVEVILGSVQEPVIFGRYADQQAQLIGGAAVNDNRDTRPSGTAVAKIYANYYGSSVPVAVAPVVRVAAAPQVTVARPVVQAPAPAVKVVQQPVVQRVVRTEPVKPVVVASAKKEKKSKKKGKSSGGAGCVFNSAGRSFCVGDTVKNAWGFDQKIVSVDQRRGEVSLISELYAEPYIRSVDMLGN